MQYAYEKLSQKGRVPLCGDTLLFITFSIFYCFITFLIFYCAPSIAAHCSSIAAQVASLSAVPVM